jgi:AcrR family transcriptional regulator
MLLSEERTDPRVTRTRKLLADALRSLLAQKGFEQITVQDITARATVNRMTFYAHFTDKYAMVGDLFRDLFAQMLTRRIHPRAGSAQEHLRQLFLAVADHWVAIHGECRPTHRLFEQQIEEQIKVQLRDNARDWLMKHLNLGSQSRRQLDLAATLISWSIYGAALEWQGNASGQSAEDFADEVIPLIAATVAALGGGPHEARP